MILVTGTSCQRTPVCRAIALFFGAAVQYLLMALSQQHLCIAQDEGVASEKIQSVAFSPDGKLLAGGSWDNTVRVWDADTGETKRTLSGHEGPVRTVAFAPEGNLLASGSDDGSVIVWEAETGEQKRVFGGFKRDLYDLCFLADGRTLIAGSVNITFLNVKTGKQMSVLELDVDCIRSVAVSPDEETLAVTALNRDRTFTASLYDLRRGKPRRTLGGEGLGFYRICFSPDGERLAATCHGRTEGPSVRIWDAKTGEVQTILTPNSKQIWAIAFSPDGAHLASGGAGHSVTEVGIRGERKLSALTVWGVCAKRELLILDGELGRVNSVCFSPDGKRLAYCDHRSVSVVDTKSGGVIWKERYGLNR